MWSSSSSFIMTGSQTSTESPLHSIAQYIEDYMDLVENVPNDIARQITQLHEHNHRYHQLMSQLESTLDLICNKTTNELRKRNSLLKIQRNLIEVQEIADEKLILIQSILDQLDGKARQLDFDYRSVTMLSSSPSIANNSRLQLNIGNTSIVNTNHSNAQKSEANNSTANASSNVNNSNTTAHEVIAKEVINGNSNGSNANNANITHTTPQSLSGKRASARRNTTSRGHHDNNDHIAAKRAVKRGIKASHKELKRTKSMINTNNNSSLLLTNDSPPNLYEGVPIDPDEPTYCLCEQVSFGEMICCDNSTCKIEWFHFSCVSLNTKPKGKWFCPNCRGERSNLPKK